MPHTEDSNNPVEELGGAIAEAPAAASEEVEHVAETLNEAAEQASEAARSAANPKEHEVLAGVSEALHLLRAELKRANDFREFEQNQAAKVVEENAEIASQPVAEVVQEKPARYVRRGARKVKK